MCLALIYSCSLDSLFPYVTHSLIPDRPLSYPSGGNNKNDMDPRITALNKYHHRAFGHINAALNYDEQEDGE